MAKLQAVDEIFKSLGVQERTNIEFCMWKPEEDEGHPQGFIGTYKGYKIAETEQGGRTSEFDIFFFDDCGKHSPQDGSSGWGVSSSFMLDNLKYVEPGVKVAIVFAGKEKNKHGGQTRNIEWSFLNKEDRVKRVASQLLPASNQAQYNMLSANGTT